MKRAFSIVELMAVVVIIASTAALLFPAFVSAKQSAKSLVCISNLHNIGLATSLYTSDHDGVLPRSTNYFERLLTKPVQLGKPPEIDAASQPTPQSLLAPYTKNEQIFMCSEDRGLRLGYSFESYPHFYTRNDGSSYLFADLYEGQTESSWQNPSNSYWATDGTPNWHIPNLDQTNFENDHINALAYDLHVKTVKNRNGPDFIP